MTALNLACELICPYPSARRLHVAVEVVRMAIPSNQDIMLPLLRYAGDEREHVFREAIDVLSRESGLSAEERAQLRPKSKNRVFENRVRWAGTYLYKAGLLARPSRNMLRITERGLN